MSTIDPPIPLSDPSGTVMAYACPRCRHISAHVSGGTVESRLEYSQRDASRCCLCSRCGVRVDRYESYCPTCKKAEDARIAAVLAERKPAEDVFARLYEERLSKAKDRDAALMLERLMSDISEEYYCAGWLNTLDTDLWRIITTGDGRFGMGVLTKLEIRELKRLHEKSGGWWASEEGGVLFTTEWPR